MEAFREFVGMGQQGTGKAMTRPYSSDFVSHLFLTWHCCGFFRYVFTTFATQM